ncbi:MAG: tetratricopeptide repeat protein [Lachnospiraceae bacterium]|nr:tetratricopeptide repeat protein [Lachnospiraceae bacterium]
MACFLMACSHESKDFKKAESLADKGDYAESLKYYEAAIKNDDERSDYYVGYGIALTHLGRYKEAIEPLTKAANPADNSVTRSYTKESYLGLSIVYYYLHDYMSSISFATEALKIKEFPTLNYKLRLMLGASYAMTGDMENAYKTYNAAIKDSPKEAVAYYELGLLYKRNADALNPNLSVNENVTADGSYESNFTEAEKNFSECLKNDGNYYDAYFSLYELYNNNGDTEKAETLLDELYNKQGNSGELLCVKGRVCYTRGDLEESGKLYKTAAENGYGDAYYHLGNLYMEQLDYESAAGAFTNALETADGINKGKIYFALSNCNVKLRDYDKALEYIEAGLNNADSSVYENLLINRVIILEKLGRYGEALASANEFMGEFPESEKMKKEVQFINSRITGQKLNKKLARQKKKEQAAASENTDGTTDGTTTDGTTTDGTTTDGTTTDGTTTDGTTADGTQTTDTGTAGTQATTDEVSEEEWEEENTIGTEENTETTEENTVGTEETVE